VLQVTLRERGSGQTSGIEARILALAAAGCTSNRIATEVGLTADGVDYHLTRLFRRWGAQPEQLRWRAPT
jgi:DNA-binding CsgD family transcriptional regulator